MEYPPLEQFEAWVREWQPLLGLQAWKIKVALVPSKKLSDPNHTAENWANHEQRVSEIRISQDEEDDEYIDPGSKQWEETIVHELVHLVMDAALPQKRMGHHQDLLYEQGISALAKALLRVKLGPLTHEGDQRPP